MLILIAQFKAYMNEMLEEKKNSANAEAESDLFSIILASNNEDSGDRLSDSELLGDLVRS